MTATNITTTTTTTTTTTATTKSGTGDNLRACRAALARLDPSHRPVQYEGQQVNEGRMRGECEVNDSTSN